MPRFRFTLRRMMIAVAGLAVGMGSLVRLERLSREYQSRTLESYDEAVKSEMKRLSLKMRLQFPPRKMTPEEEATIKFEIRKASGEIEYYKGMQAKYGWAVGHPWFPVAPDPPGPR